MKVMGITGSVASGKTTVAHLMAGKKYPLFKAYFVVSSLNKKKKFIKILVKRFKLNSKKKIKDQIKLILKKNKINLYKLESIIHPYVKKEMKTFLKKKNKILILEIPLLIESKLNKYFDKLIFVGANEKLRLKRYLRRNSDKKTFNLLNKRQLPRGVKKKICDYTIDNNYSLAILKKNAKNFIKHYE